MSEENVEILEPSFEVTDLIQNALDQDFNNANKVFGNIMGVKVDDALEQEKIRLADTIFNGAEDEEELDDPSEEDQLELDLEGEGESESEEQDDEEDDEVEDNVDETDDDDDGLELEDEE